MNNTWYTLTTKGVNLVFFEEPDGSLDIDAFKLIFSYDYTPSYSEISSIIKDYDFEYALNNHIIEKLSRPILRNFNDFSQSSIFMLQSVSSKKEALISTSDGFNVASSFNEKDTELYSAFASEQMSIIEKQQLRGLKLPTCLTFNMSLSSFDHSFSAARINLTNATSYILLARGKILFNNTALIDLVWNLYQRHNLTF